MTLLYGPARSTNLYDLASCTVLSAGGPNAPLLTASILFLLVGFGFESPWCFTCGPDVYQRTPVTVFGGGFQGRRDGGAVEDLSRGVAHARGARRCWQPYDDPRQSFGRSPTKREAPSAYSASATSATSSWGSSLRGRRPGPREVSPLEFVTADLGLQGVLVYLTGCISS